jgi:predicted nucleotidyltransferase
MPDGKGYSYENCPLLKKMLANGECLMGALIKSKQDIMKILHQNRARLKALGVRRIGVFGSFVRGEQHDDSDIDLLVEFELGQKSFDAFMELCFLLEEVFQQRIELVTLESLSPYIGPHILKEVEYASLAA